MAEPWLLTLTPTGWWQVHYGDGPDDFVSFPPEREREARMTHAAPLVQEAAEDAGAELRRLIVGIAGPSTNHAEHKVAHALAACEPIRQGDSHD